MSVIIITNYYILFALLHHDADKIYIVHYVYNNIINKEQIFFKTFDTMLVLNRFKMCTNN